MRTVEQRRAAVMTLARGNRTDREIAQALGVSVTTVRRDLAMVRSNGLRHTPKRTQKPHGKRRGRQPLFTRQQITDALNEFYNQHGRVPNSSDFWPLRLRAMADLAERSGQKTKARKLRRRAREIERRGLPQAPHVASVFGTWNAGLIEAGLTPSRLGLPGPRSI